MLLSACEQRNVNSVKKLITPETLEEKNEEGFTSLSLASKLGEIAIIDLLLSAGANINTINNVNFTQ